MCGTLAHMADAPNADAIEAEARKLLDQRVESVRELAKAQADVTHLEERHAEEMREVAGRHAESYAAAVKAGWDDKELKKLGLNRPSASSTKRSRRRPKGGASSEDSGADRGSADS